MSMLRPVALLALLTLLAPSQVMGQRATPTMSTVDVPSLPFAPGGGEVLYDQSADQDEQNFPSQEFQALNSEFDSQGADDFVVPESDTWNVSQVDLFGAYRPGTLSPATIADVYFYADADGSPGEELAAFTDVSIDDSDADGDWSVMLPSPVTLAGGTYWVSVFVDMDSVVAGEGEGQWFWTKQATESPIGNELHWRNPNNGFETGCTEWSALTTDCGDEGGLDASFRLIGNTAVANEEEGSPTAFSVSQNYPNPFAAETAVDIELAEAARVTVTVYDVLGREVEVLLDAQRPAGTHRVTWTAANVPVGLYFCRIESGSRSRTLRMTVAR